MTNKIKNKIETETEVTINGNLELTENFKTEKKLIVKGNIFGKDGLKWDINAGNINALNIDARNIDARDIDAENIKAENIKAWDIKAWDINAENINALNIKAWDIKAWDINAGNINALDIICETRKKKYKEAKTFCRIYIKNKSKIDKRTR